MLKQRKNQNRSYRKKIIISVEGKTEKNYFAMFKQNNNLVLLCHDNKSAPQYVFNRINHWLKKQKIKKCEYNKYIKDTWLVIDREAKSQRSDEEISNIHNKCNKAGYKLAVSNPKFEYWILLHYENAKKINNGQDCDKRLRNYKFSKTNLDLIKLKASLADAIMRAKAKDSPQTKDWPRIIGTTVYRLVEKLI